MATRYQPKAIAPIPGLLMEVSPVTRKLDTVYFVNLAYDPEINDRIKALGGRWNGSAWAIPPAGGEALEVLVTELRAAHPSDEAMARVVIREIRSAEVRSAVKEIARSLSMCRDDGREFTMMEREIPVFLRAVHAVSMEHGASVDAEVREYDRLVPRASYRLGVPYCAAMLEGLGDRYGANAFDSNNHDF